MFGRRRKVEEGFKVFPIEQTPDLEYQHNELDIKIYFMENYENGEEAIKRQLTYVNHDETSFSILLEKRLYDLAPELYTKESLAAQHAYFTTKPTMNMWLLLGGGFGIIIAISFIASLYTDGLLSIVLGVIGGSMYTMWMFTRSFNRDLKNSAEALRAEMIRLCGEEKLDELVERQQEYAKQFTFEEDPK